MLGTVDWIAIGLGCVCGIAALVFWRSASEAKLRQRQLQREYEQLQLDLQNGLGEAEAIRRQLQELIDRPPLPADPHFAEHLSALGERIADRLLELDGARVSSAEPLRLAAEESEQSRVIERKKRFAGYRDTLFEANVEINGHVERLLDCHAAVLVVRDAVKAGHLDPRVGHAYCLEIRTVIEALDREESPDETWRNAIRNINREFDPVLKMRDQERQRDRSTRDADRAAAASAFDKYRLPPITPLEKFHALASRGQRDGFDG